jgi:hypothetical protein
MLSPRGKNTENATCLQHTQMLQCMKIANTRVDMHYL